MECAWVLMRLRLMPEVPNVWTDGSLVLDEVTGVSSSGSGFFAHQSGEGVGGSMLILSVLLLVV